jgi:hypothetical protein
MQRVAGPSGTPLAKKLGVGEEDGLVLLHGPDRLVLDLPSGLPITRRLPDRAHVVLAFFTNALRLDRDLEGLGSAIFPAGSLWIAWPKRSSGVATDITDHRVRELALPRGLVDNKVCAIDPTWTALRLVWRREHRDHRPDVSGRRTDGGPGRSMAPDGRPGVGPVRRYADRYSATASLPMKSYPWVSAWMLPCEQK